MLTDIEIRKAKPADKPYKLTDSNGLYLFITAQGSKLWRMNYSFNGSQKTLSIGEYPLITLTEARAKRDEAKKLLLNNIDPSANKKATKSAERGKSEHCFKNLFIIFSSCYYCLIFVQRCREPHTRAT